MEKVTGEDVQQDGVQLGFNHDGHGTSTCTREVNTPNAHNRAWVGLCTDWLADLFNYHL